MPSYCSVPGCGKDAVPKFHKLPVHEAQAREWLKRIGNPKFPEGCLDIEKVSKTVRICHRHFADHCLVPREFKSKRGIRENSMPTLYLPMHIDPTIENSFYVEEHRQLEATASLPGCSSDYGIDLPATTVTAEETTHVRKSTKHLKRRYNFVRTLGARRAMELTPKRHKLYTIAKDLRRTAKRLFVDKAAALTRIAEASSAINTMGIFKSAVNRATMDFLLGQLRHQSLRPRGRRFTVEEKTLSLSLMKQSPRGYRLLQQIFALPSRKSLNNILSRLSFHCGQNEHVLESLKKTVIKMAESEKLCVLLFDEMSLEPGLHFSLKRDFIVGFEDLGEETQNCRFADHALVFMARGIYKKWKQPICYYFSESGLSGAQLKVLIKSAIQQLQSIGLRVVATVCDQLSANVTAYNLLKQETAANCLRAGIDNRYEGFFVGDQEVVPLFDGPHLLKGLRNNLLSHDAQFETDGSTHSASWRFVQMLYEHDVANPRDWRMVPRLTEGHVYASKMKKMKVSVAAQVFSQRVAQTLHHLAERDASFSDADGTAQFLIFGDKLFDSVNGSNIHSVDEKTLRCAMTANSSHLEFWNQARKTLDTVRFKFSNDKWSVPPTIKNWKLTISGLQYIWNNLCTEFNVTSLPTRHFNQDLVENFFGSIRSHGVRNINPTCWSFIASFKTQIVNNFMSSHSLGSNCEQDDCDGALDTLKEFLENENGGVTSLEEFSLSINLEYSLPAEVTQAAKYVAGYVAKRLRAKVKCNLCLEDLVADGEVEEHDLIHHREYKSGVLVRASRKFIDVFVRCYALLQHVIPQICAQRQLTLLLKTLLANQIVFNFSCPQHELQQEFMDILVPFFLYFWVKNINKILRGTLCSTKTAGLDDIQKLAHVKYTKFKSKRAKIAQLKGTI